MCVQLCASIGLYLIWFLEEKCSQQVFTCVSWVLISVKCSETIYPPEGFTPWPHIREYPQTPFRLFSIKCALGMGLKVLWNIILSESLELHCYRKAVLPEIKSADDKKNRIVSWEFCEIVCYCLWLLCKCFLSWWPLFTANYLFAFVIILISPTAYQSKCIAWLSVQVHLSLPLLTVTLM